MFVGPSRFLCVLMDSNGSLEGLMRPYGFKWVFISLFTCALLGTSSLFLCLNFAESHTKKVLIYVTRTLFVSDSAKFRH